jgi:hypothetical protein
VGEVGMLFLLLLLLFLYPDLQDHLLTINQVYTRSNVDALYLGSETHNPAILVGGGIS